MNRYDRGIRAPLWLPAACACVIACTGGRPGPSPAEPALAAPAEPALAAPALADRVLVEPESFDLQLPKDFFVTGGRGLPASPALRLCHTQGLAIAGSDLILSCVLHDPDRAAQRTLEGKSYLLRAPLCEITGCGGAPARGVAWAIEDITQEAPADESLRITRMLLGQEALSAEERALRHLMTHPSGLVYDAGRGGVWVANAVYTADSYSSILLLRPDTLGGGRALARASRVIQVRDHIGALALVEERYLVGLSWGSQRLVVFDLDGDGAPVTVGNPLAGGDDHTEIQDCDTWGADRVLCGGVRKYEASPGALDAPVPEDVLADPERQTVRVRRGRLPVLRIDAQRLPAVAVHLEGHVRASFASGSAPSMDIGVRAYHRDEDGRIVDLGSNDYGGYELVLPLTYEGMTLDSERQFVYFVADDVPRGRLVRMRLQRAER